MSDNEMPTQPKTKELPAVDKQDILLAEMRRGFATVEGRLDSQDTKLDKVVTEGIEANVRLDRVEVRLGKVESRVEELESRTGRNSSRVREASENDMAHDAQLAQERAARESLAAKVDSLTKTQDTQLSILVRLDRVASNPLVKTLGAMLLTAVITYLASHGITVPR
jgi:hypothetical protein